MLAASPWSALIGATALSLSDILDSTSSTSSAVAFGWVVSVGDIVGGAGVEFGRTVFKGS